MDRLKLAGNALVVAAAALFLGYYSTWLLWEDLKPWLVYKVSFRRTLGLEKKDDVLAYGLKIGRVREVSLEGDHHLVVIEVEPGVRFWQTGPRAPLKVEIKTVDAFGTAVVDVVPGDPSTQLTWPSDKTIEGTSGEGLTDAPPEVSGTRALSDTIHDWEETTGSLLRAESGTAGRVLNDGDLAADITRAFRDFADSTASFRDRVERIDAGEGPGALLTGAPEHDLRGTVAAMHDELALVRESAAEARRGEGGLAGRLLGDADAATGVRRSLADAAEIVSAYPTGEGRLGPLFSRSGDAGDRLLELLQGLERETADANDGKGPAGALLGPSTGEEMKAQLAGLDEKVASALYADPGSGAIFSPDEAGRRLFAETAEEKRAHKALADLLRNEIRKRVEERDSLPQGEARKALDGQIGVLKDKLAEVERPQGLLDRVESVLLTMRKTVVRLRADQTPNTFQGALFSVF